MPDEDCIFCKIVAGDLPSERVDEDEHTIAFMDINPWTRGHALVIPRNHSKNLYEAPEEDLEHAVVASQRLATRMRDRLGAEGVNLLNCCEPAAWQTVFHLHIHVIPRWQDDPLKLPGTPRQPGEGELAEVAAELEGMSDRARYERDGDLGVLTIDDPPLNLFGRELTEAVVDAVDAAAADGPRALIVRAEGSVFTGGADVNVFHGLSEAQSREFTAELLSITHRVEDLPFPTLAVVHGLCLTAGFELSLACDMIWAAESAQFGLVEIVVGLTPLMGGTQRVAERAGPARARELVMSGGLYPAATLERWNVVNRVLPDGELAEKATKFGHRLASGPTVANAATKRIVRAQTDEGTRGADARTADIGAPLFETEDLKGAVEKFLSEGPGKASFRGQ